MLRVRTEASHIAAHCFDCIRTLVFTALRVYALSRRSISQFVITLILGLTNPVLCTVRIVTYTHLKLITRLLGVHIHHVDALHVF